VRRTPPPEGGEDFGSNKQDLQRKGLIVPTCTQWNRNTGWLGRGVLKYQELRMGKTDGEVLLELATSCRRGKKYRTDQGSPKKAVVGKEGIAGGGNKGPVAGGA